MERIEAFIGVGSNLEDPVRQVSMACCALAELPRCDLLARSSLFANPAIGPGDQPDYVNAVAQIATTLAPLELLDCLQAIEREQGRMRGAIRWSARTLDLDIVLYGDHVIASERLVVPHPRMHERAFVLYPLHEIAPDVHVPGQGTLARLLLKVDGDSMRKLADNGAN